MQKVGFIRKKYHHIVTHLVGTQDYSIVHLRGISRDQGKRIVKWLEKKT